MNNRKVPNAVCQHCATFCCEHSFVRIDDGLQSDALAGSNNESLITGLSHSLGVAEECPVSYVNSGMAI